MIMDNLEKVIAEAINLVKEASEYILEGMADKKVITKSGTANFVTEIDIKVQEVIVKRLKEILPESNIIAEETDQNDFTLSKYTWVLDPVDGTTNLMYGFMFSAISLALIVDGVPYAGIVYNPFMKEMFFAERGKGAFVNEKPIAVSKNKELQDSLITFGTSPYNREMAEDTFRIAKNVYLKCRDLRRTGSAALDICYVAAGRIDGFYEMILQPWDYAGAAIVLEEAGGKITDWNGNSLTYIEKAPTLASNGYIHKELLEELG